MEKQGQTALVKGWVIIVSAFIIGLALTAAAGLNAYGVIQAKQAENTASAEFVGTASREIESDHAKWSITLTHTASSTAEALAGLDKDREALRKAVTQAGITDKCGKGNVFDDNRTDGVLYPQPPPVCP